MKKIFCLITLLAGVTMFTSCSDDDATYTPKSALEIKSADLSFEAAGGTGEIVVSNPAGTLTATTESNWLTLSVSGNTVTVNVNENTTLNGRSANIVLKAGDTETQLSATQKGGTYGLSGGTVFNVNNDAKTLNISLVHSSAVELNSLADWITATFDTENDQVVLKLAANDTGWRRSGLVAMKTGDIKDTISVTQFDFLNDMQGDYALVYYSSSAGGYVYTTVNITTTSDSATGLMTFTGGSLANLGVVIPININTETMSFTINNFEDLDAKYTKDDVEYTLCTMVMMTNGSSIYRVKPASLPSLTASLVEEEDGTIIFDMSAVYSTYDFYGLRIGYGTGGYEGYKAAYTTFPYCYLMKM